MTADGQVALERVITTYRENAIGAADPSYYDLPTLKLLATLRYDLRNYMSLHFPRYKLADDGTDVAAGQATVTPKILKAHILARFRFWETLGLVQNFEAFKAGLIVVRDPNDRNRVNARLPVPLINFLNVFAAQIQFQ